MKTLELATVKAMLAEGHKPTDIYARWVEVVNGERTAEEKAASRLILAEAWGQERESNLKVRGGK